MRNLYCLIATIRHTMSLHAQNGVTQITLQTHRAVIPPTMYGLFFEDISIKSNKSL